MERARRAPRLTLDARIEGRADFMTDVRVVDLSPSGAMLEVPRYLAPRSEISVSLALDGDPLSLRARVIYCSNDGESTHRAGIEFVALPSPLRRRIREYLEQDVTHERREEPRIFVGQQAQIKKVIELRVLNLNLFGGLFSVSFPLEFRSEHDFVFRLPDGEVHVRGVVRHCEAWAEAKGAAIFRLGVEFTELNEPDRERVVSYLEDLIQGS